MTDWLIIAALSASIAIGVAGIVMKAMLSMQDRKRTLDRHHLATYRRAMHAARSAMPRITRDGKITNKQGQVQSRYAHYEAIDKIVRPLVEAEGLTYGFDTVALDGNRVGVTCIVSHIDGHEERFGPMPLAIDTTGAKNATQGAGSASSYGKRYTLCGAFNIVTQGEDDDGTSGRTTAAEAPGFDHLVDDGQKAAAAGTEPYAKWFNSLTNMQKGWLVDEGHHARIKRAAAEIEMEKENG